MAGGRAAWRQTRGGGCGAARPVARGGPERRALNNVLHEAGGGADPEPRDDPTGGHSWKLGALSEFSARECPPPLPAPAEK